MELLTEEEFIDYYIENKKLPFPLSTPKSFLSEYNLKSKYKDYVRRMEHNQEKMKDAKTYKPPESNYATSVQKNMDEFRAKDDRRPFLEYFKKLTKLQQDAITEELWMCPKNKDTGYPTWDVAHIIERGENQRLADKQFNYILLPRNFHHHIDFYENPLTKEHERITKEQHDQIWIDLIGQELWNRLINY